MTKVAKLFEKEKQEALRAEKRNVVEKLLKNRIGIQAIIDVTDLAEEKIKR